MDPDRIGWAYREETDSRKLARLEQAYAKITGGEDIQSRIDMLD